MYVDDDGYTDEIDGSWQEGGKMECWCAALFCPIAWVHAPCFLLDDCCGQRARNRAMVLAYFCIVPFRRTGP